MVKIGDKVWVDEREVLYLKVYDTVNGYCVGVKLRGDAQDPDGKERSTVCAYFNREEPDVDGREALARAVAAMDKAASEIGALIGAGRSK